jgi:hypothetical protein
MLGQVLSDVGGTLGERPAPLDGAPFNGNYPESFPAWFPQIKPGASLSGHLRA